MKQNRLLAFVLGLAIAALALPYRVTAGESFDPAKDLKHDIQILGLMVGKDLSQYPLPTIKIVPEAEFNAYMEKLAEEVGVVQEKRFGGYQPCDTDPNLVMISSAYSEVAALPPNPIEPDKYFRTIRVHELYHWAWCQVAGSDRFWNGQNAWLHEEGLARSVESQFTSEQLGKVAAVPEEYQFPSMPRETSEGSLPDDGKETEYFGLRTKMWKLAGDVPGLIQWKTVSDSVIFVGVAQAAAFVDRPDYFPNYDLPGQHIPNYNLALGSGLVYYFNAVMHKGHYVGFEVFEVEGDRAMFGIRQGLWTKKYSWWDKGYVPPDGKGFVPDSPVYTGKWVQTFPEK